MEAVGLELRFAVSAPAPATFALLPPDLAPVHQLVLIQQSIACLLPKHEPHHGTFFSHFC